MSRPGHPRSTSFFQKAASCAVGSAIIWRTNLVGQLSARKRLAASRSISCSSENPKSNLRASVLSMGILRLETAQIHVSGTIKAFSRASGGTTQGEDRHEKTGWGKVQLHSFFPEINARTPEYWSREVCSASELISKPVKKPAIGIGPSALLIYAESWPGML